MCGMGAGGRSYSEELAALRARVAELERAKSGLTKSRDADEDLDGAWAEWERTFDAARDSIMVLDGDFKIVQANLATCRFSGKPLAQIIGRTCWQIIHGTDRPCAECPLMVAQNTRNHEEAEVYVRQRDIWIEISVDPILNDQGRIEKTIHIIRDVTERRRAVDALAASEDRFRSIFDNANDVIGFITRLGKILEINKRVKDVLGYDREELIGRNFLTSGFLAARNMATIVRLFKQAVDAGGFPHEQGRDRMEVWLNHKDGHPVLVEASTTAVRKDGKLEGFLSILHDVTERRKAEEAYRSLVDHSLQGLAIFQNGRVAFANQAMAQISGYSVRKMLEASPEEVQAFVHPEDRELVWRRHQQRLNGEVLPERYEIRGIRKDGSVCWLEIQASRIEYQGKPAVQAAYVDITQRKAAAEALRQSERKFRSIFETAANLITSVNREGIIVDCNGRVREFLGYEKAEVIGQPMARIIHPDYLEKARRSLAEIFSKGFSYNKEYKMVRKNGSVIDVSINSSAIGDEHAEHARTLCIVDDITERKKAEHLLRKERDKAQKYLDVAAVMMVAVDSEQRVGLINNKGCEILGYAEEEIVGKNWFDNFLPERVRDQVKALFEKFVRGQADASEYVENPILTRDGRERLIAWHNTMLRDDRGNFVATLSSGEDITERRRAEQALRRSEENYRDLFESAREAILTFDLGGNITGANKLVEEYGFRREQLIGRPLFEFVAEDHRAKAVEDFETLLRGCAVRGEMDVMTPKGVMTVEYSDNPITRAGKVVGVQAILTDITERKRVEAAIRESQDRLKILFESAPDAIYLTDLQGCFVDGNIAAEQLSGFSRSELIGKTITETGLLSRDQVPKVEAALQRTAAGQPVGPDEFTLTRKDGGHVVVEIRAYPVRIKGQTLALGIARDITRRKTIEQALKRQTLLSRAFLDSMPCVALLLRSHTRQIVASNRQAHEIGAIPTTTCYRTWAGRESPCPWCRAPQVWQTGEPQHLVVESEGTVWDAHWVPIEKDLYLHYAFDITQRTRVEESLRESGERYRSLFEGSLHPITICDREANIVMLNDIGAKNLKKPFHEIVGRPVGEFIPQIHEQTVQRVRKVLDSGEPLFVEDEVLLPDGKCWFLSTLHPVVSHRGQSDLVQIISYDITERKRAEEKLIRYQQQLRAMASEILRAEDRERKRLALGLHDNICQRLVLTKLAIESSLPLVSNAKLAASLRIAAEAIGETIEEADSLTFELSNPVLREFGLVPALEKYLTEEVRRKHGIACELEADGQIGALSDETRTCLFRVMRELLTNAVRHGRAARIKVTIHKSQGQLCLKVCDDGIGFNLEDVNGGASKKTRFGLFSVREQLEYLGGSLDVDSEPGRGTTATVVVPHEIRGMKDEDTDRR